MKNKQKGKFIGLFYGQEITANSSKKKLVEIIDYLAKEMKHWQDLCFKNNRL